MKKFRLSKKGRCELCLFMRVFSSLLSSKSRTPQETDSLSMLAENKSRKVEASIDSLVEASSGEPKP